MPYKTSLDTAMQVFYIYVRDGQFPLISRVDLLSYFMKLHSKVIHMFVFFSVTACQLLLSEEKSTVLKIQKKISILRQIE